MGAADPRRLPRRSTSAPGSRTDGAARPRRRHRPYSLSDHPDRRRGGRGPAAGPPATGSAAGSGHRQQCRRLPDRAGGHDRAVAGRRHCRAGGRGRSGGSPRPVRCRRHRGLPRAGPLRRPGTPRSPWPRGAGCAIAASRSWWPTGPRSPGTLALALAGAARCVLRETLVLGRQGEAGGWLRSRTEAYRDGRPIWLEEHDLDPDGIRNLPGLLGPARVIDSLVSLGPPPEAVPRRPGELSAARGCRYGAAAAGRRPGGITSERLGSAGAESGR